MTSLYIAFALLTLLVLPILVLPFILRNKSVGLSQSSLNQRLFQLRSKELNDEDSQGLNDDKQSLLVELQYNLLDDIPNKEPALAATFCSPWVLLPGALWIILGSIFLYIYLGAQPQLVRQQEALQNLPELSQLALSGKAPLTSEQLDNFALGLRTKLQQSGDDAMGWWLLARVGQALNRMDMLLDASEKAYLLDPNSASITGLYVQALLYSGEPSSKAKAERLTVLALQQQPDNLDLWSLYAFMALEAEQYAQAIERWQHMQSLLEIGSERHQMLQQSIDYAQQQLPPASKANLAEGEYQVRVELADNVEFSEGGFLFISAKAATGSPIPLAVKKIAHPSFPLTVTLSDQDSMMEGLLLSQQSEFYISARLSVDQSVATTEGDWQGRSLSIVQGEQAPISLVIDVAL